MLVGTGGPRGGGGARVAAQAPRPRRCSAVLCWPRSPHSPTLVEHQRQLGLGAGGKHAEHSEVKGGRVVQQRWRQEQQAGGGAGGAPVWAVAAGGEPLPRMQQLPVSEQHQGGGQSWVAGKPWPPEPHRWWDSCRRSGGREDGRGCRWVVAGGERRGQCREGCCMESVGDGGSAGLGDGRESVPWGGRRESGGHRRRSKPPPPPRPCSDSARQGGAACGRPKAGPRASP